MKKPTILQILQGYDKLDAQKRREADKILGLIHVDEFVETVKEEVVEEYNPWPDAMQFTYDVNEMIKKGRAYFTKIEHEISKAGLAPAHKFLHCLASMECVLGFFNRPSDTPLLASRFKNKELFQQQLAERGFPTDSVEPVVGYVQNLFRKRVGQLYDQPFKNSKQILDKYFDSQFNYKFPKLHTLLAALSMAGVRPSNLLGGIESRSPLVNDGNVCEYFDEDESAARVNEHIAQALEFRQRRFHFLGEDDASSEQLFNAHKARERVGMNLAASWKHAKHDLAFYLHVADWLDVSLDDLFGTVGQSEEDIDMAKSAIHKSDCERWFAETDTEI